MNVSILKYVLVVLGNEPNSCPVFFFVWEAGSGPPNPTPLNFKQCLNSLLTKIDPGPCSPTHSHPARKFLGSAHAIYFFSRFKISLPMSILLTLFRLFQRLHSSSSKFWAGLFKEHWFNVMENVCQRSP